jgi:hypothetical protein
MIPEDEPAATGEAVDTKADGVSLVKQEDSELEEILSDYLGYFPAERDYLSYADLTLNTSVVCGSN